VHPRCIQLYTFKEEVILDPFIGSGQTAIAAIKTGRYSVGYEINEEYVKLAEKRIKNFLHTFKSPNLFDYLKEEEIDVRDGV